jgi:hypothetical protein
LTDTGQVNRICHNQLNKSPLPSKKKTKQPESTVGMKNIGVYFCLVAALATSALAGVTVTSPHSGATTASPVSFVANATSATCSRGVASMGIYVDDKLVYVVNDPALNTKVSMGAGAHRTVVQEWDYCGGSRFTEVAITVTAKSAVWVTSPANNSTVGGPVRFTATATSTCPKGVASMGIYTAPSPDARVYVVNGSSLNTSLMLGPGTYNTVVQEWDYCGGSTFTPVKITVGGKKLYNVQASDGWRGWGELRPAYEICTTCSPKVTYGMTQTGGATKFELGGTMSYSDVLWSNPVIGQGSTQGLPDNDEKLVPSLKHFIYDAYFYSPTTEASQVLEFDISQYFQGLSFIYGTQCRIAGGHEWDIWDNTNHVWKHTGIACNPKNGSWNHVVIQASRTSDNHLLYESITFNEVVHTLNKYDVPDRVPSGWNGITLKFQMDGNYKQQPYTVYLDKLHLTYW